MTKSELIKKLNESYPDGFLEFYWDMKTGGVRNAGAGGDTLALFVVREIESVWEDGATDAANLGRVANALEQASSELSTLCEKVSELELAHVRALCRKSSKKRKKGPGAR